MKLLLMKSGRNILCGRGEHTKVSTLSANASLIQLLFKCLSAPRFCSRANETHPYQVLRTAVNGKEKSLCQQHALRQCSLYSCNSSAVPVCSWPPTLHSLELDKSQNWYVNISCIWGSLLVGMTCSETPVDTRLISLFIDSSFLLWVSVIPER